MGIIQMIRGLWFALFKKWVDDDYKDIEYDPETHMED